MLRNGWLALALGFSHGQPFSRESIIPRWRKFDPKGLVFIMKDYLFQASLQVDFHTVINWKQKVQKVVTQCKNKWSLVNVIYIYRICSYGANTWKSTAIFIWATEPFKIEGKEETEFLREKNQWINFKPIFSFFLPTSSSAYPPS